MQNLTLIIALIFSLNIIAQKELIDTFEITKQTHLHSSKKYSNCTGDPECAKHQIREFKECNWEAQIGYTRKESSVSKIIVIQGKEVIIKLYNGLNKKIATYIFQKSFFRNENNGMEVNNSERSITFYSNTVVLSDKYGLTEFNYNGHKEESRNK